MNDFQTDDEKVEELKAWWKENGTSVMVGIGLAIVALFGWQQWKDWQTEHAVQASALYSEVAKNADKSWDIASSNVIKLQDDYKSTPYAAVASLKTADIYAPKGAYEPAVKALNWVIENSSEDAYKDLAQVRLARIFIAQNKLADAEKLANATYPKAYESIVEELKGDIFVAQKKLADARTAYDKAMVTSKGDTELLKMKRANLGEGV
jgi:predicted negative regulator of RcsB-dependent stress response